MSQAALCTSGTVAVELQLARLPSLVAYRAHFLTELLIRYKAKIPYISLPNILLDSPIIPEALFQACNPSNLALTLEYIYFFSPTLTVYYVIQLTRTGHDDDVR